MEEVSLSRAAAQAGWTNAGADTTAQRRAATVTDLCQVTGASEATIRRDLNALAKQGKLSKVHGGAMLLGGEFHGEELDMETKRGLFTQEKDRAARYAAGLIGDDDVVSAFSRRRSGNPCRTS